jgi:hypothetical protein
VLVLEVLIGELLAVDGTTTGTLLKSRVSQLHFTNYRRGKTHVAAGEVTTLEHELGDHTVESRALVALALGGIAELAEVAGGLGDIGLEEVEVDASSNG